MMKMFFGAFVTILINMKKETKIEELEKRIKQLEDKLVFPPQYPIIPPIPPVYPSGGNTCPSCGAYYIGQHSCWYNNRYPVIYC